jgi:8-oxo-dGTP pyrophosphatase MutT (NUDIX family)
MGLTDKISRLDNTLLYSVSCRSEAENAWKSFLDDALGRDMILLNEQPEEGREIFFSLFSILNAAGGIVSNTFGQLLCISRWGKWDLPKGKAEKDERHEETALREVEEECGISELEITGFNSVTFHIYEHPRKPGKWILKQTFWFDMVYRGNDRLVPQSQEDIVEARWFNKLELKEIVGNTYASLKPILERYVSSV